MYRIHQTSAWAMITWAFFISPSLDRAYYNHPTVLLHVNPTSTVTALKCRRTRTTGCRNTFTPALSLTEVKDSKIERWSCRRRAVWTLVPRSRCPLTFGVSGARSWTLTGDTLGLLKTFREDCESRVLIGANEASAAHIGVGDLASSYISRA